MPRKRGLPVPAGEIGSSGLRSSGGYLWEEFDPQLRGRRGQEKLREMYDNSAAVGAGLHAIEIVLRQVPYDIVAPTADAEGLRGAKFLDQSLNDMSFSWPETQSEAITMLRHGFALHEICYKQRNGYGDNESEDSDYDDGLIGWSKIALRGQETITHWNQDSNGGIRGAYQLVLERGEVYLPIEKCVLFRVSRERNNPQGRSLLRSAWWSWYCSKRLTEAMLIGVERDLNGLPVFRIPGNLMKASATADEKQVYEAYKSIAVNLRRGEQEGVVLPSDRPDGGQAPYYDVSLLTSGSKRSFDIPALVLQFDRWILTVLLSDMLMMGHQAVGSYALAEGKSGLFEASLNAYLELIDDAMNHYAVPRLWKLNGWSPAAAPKLKHRRIDHQSLASLADYLQKLQAANLITSPDAELEAWLRRRADMPPAPKNAKPPEAPPSPDAAPPEPGDESAPGRTGARTTNGSEHQ